jgi:hypothetical protein
MTSIAPASAADVLRHDAVAEQIVAGDDIVGKVQPKRLSRDFEPGTAATGRTLTTTWTMSGTRSKHSRSAVGRGCAGTYQLPGAVVRDPSFPHSRTVHSRGADASVPSH